FVAVLAGWIVTETGRAPWLVYGMMTHAEGVTPSLTGGMALFTLIGYASVYAVVFWAGIYYLTRVVRQGMLPEPTHDPGEVERPKRPLSAAHVPFEDASRQPTRS
uniref:cytochrome ubiquinol oxidase subunit I n=1 Tax=Halomonas sp. TaxID=1486246 RepID=UPI0035684346